MTNAERANILLMEIEAIRNGNYEGRAIDLIILTSEALKDAEILAKEVAKSDCKAA